MYDMKGNTWLGIQMVEAVAWVSPAMYAACSDTLNTRMVQKMYLGADRGEV